MVKKFVTIIILFTNGLVFANNPRIYKEKDGRSCCKIDEKYVCVGDKVNYSHPQGMYTIKDMLVRSVSLQRGVRDCFIEFKSDDSGAVFKGPMEFKNATIIARASSGGASFAAGEDRGEECMVCMETPRNPRDLICGHILCSKCYDKLAKKKALDMARISCPACRNRQPANLQGKKFCK